MHIATLWQARLRRRNSAQAVAEQTVAEYTRKQAELDAKTAKFKSGMLELKRDLGSHADELVVPPFTEGELRALSI